jgi:hypothetical protein
MLTVTELQRKADQIDGFYKALQSQETQLKEQISGIKEEIDILTKTSAVLKHLLDVMVKDEITKMAGLITYGLKTIFHDQNLTFVPKMMKKNDKMHIELKTEDDGKERDFESFGGSVAVIESFLLRILCMLKKGYAKAMFLDETFAAVGDIYIANTCKFITELCKKLKMDILLVTWQSEFEAGADHVYKVKKTPNGITVEKSR